MLCLRPTFLRISKLCCYGSWPVQTNSGTELWDQINEEADLTWPDLCTAPSKVRMYACLVSWRTQRETRWIFQIVYRALASASDRVDVSLDYKLSLLKPEQNLSLVRSHMMAAIVIHIWTDVLHSYHMLGQKEDFCNVTSFLHWIWTNICDFMGSNDHPSIWS